MFEKEIKLIFNRVKNNTIYQSNSIDYKTIKESDIPIGIKNYFYAQIYKQLCDEKKSLQINNNFDQENSIVIALEKQAEKILILEYIFTQKEFENSLENSIIFYFNFLCRPHWTILNLFFQSSNLIDISTVKLLSKNFSNYEYLLKIIIKLLEINKKKDLSRSECEFFLRRIDEEILKDYKTSDFLQLAQPIFDFIAFSSFKNDAIKIPIRALEYFFNEKGIKSIVNHLENERKNGNEIIIFEKFSDLLSNCNFSEKLEYTSLEDLNSNQILNKISTPLPPLFDLAMETKIKQKFFSDNENEMKDFIADIFKSENEKLADEMIREYFAVNGININNSDAIFFYQTILNRYKILRKD
ncbi:MAG: hypothetical protein AAB255_03780 [Bacteroidota bacterium]